MARARATVHGAVSIVNAITTKKGATLGIGLKVEVIAETRPGHGMSIVSENKSLSSRLIAKTVEKVVPKKALDRTRIELHLDSQIPTGYGLKSSSAISSAVALACARIFRPRMTDRQILLAGVGASIESKVSITGAYDDACSCYYGGFNVTDNAQKKRVRHGRGPAGLSAVIFIPRNRKRGNLKGLRTLSPAFRAAWDLARRGDYWDAMTINGLATASVLSSHPGVMTDLLERGALAASVSGNGPSIAAIARRRDVNAVRKAFSSLEGRVMVSQVSNKKAEAHKL